MASIRPQKGFQLDFLSSPADIAIGGGAKQVGKTFALLMESTRYANNKNYRGTFFRRTYTEIKAAGGLWDEATLLYSGMGAYPNISNTKYVFKSGATIKFASLDNDAKAMRYMGSQMPFIGFDELTQFSEYSFFTLLSCNRSAIGVKPYVRATCNPDPDSFVARLIDWWIDDNGWPIKERSGVLRYFIRINNNIVWGGSYQEVISSAKEYFEDFNKRSKSTIDPKSIIKSITFIPGSIFDNTKLLEVNPGSLANLESLPDDQKMRLLYGNWKIKLDGNLLANPEAIKSMIDTRGYNTNGIKRITCDASGLGRDLTVIFVWSGLCVVYISILRQTDGPDIYNEIERLRLKFNVIKQNTIVDSDGVGNSTIKRGGYVPFHGGHAPVKKEAYANLKTQCYYTLCDKINNHEITVCFTGDNCCIDGVITQKIKIKGKILHVSDLIEEDMRAIRYVEPGDGKRKINSKEDQKIILGRSPDFGDTLMMLIYALIRPVIW